MAAYIPPHLRQGNSLPPTVDQGKRATVDRESMLYSYANTVMTSYTGDIRHYVKKFGDYLKSKNCYVDLAKNEEIYFPIRYAAPNIAFSDDKGVLDAAEEASVKDRIVLPVISYYLKGMEYDAKRAIDPCVRFRVRPKNADPHSKAGVATAPKPIKYSFQVDIWTETRETYYQILTAFQLDFNPYSYLTDLFDFDDETEKTFYTPYAKMTLDSYSDTSNYIPGTDRRVVRGTLGITVEGWLTNPPRETSVVHNVHSTIL